VAKVEAPTKKKHWTVLGEAMKQKYIEERVRPWFKFGEYESGRVDISDSQGDIFTNLDSATAAILLGERDRHIKRVTEIINAID